MNTHQIRTALVPGYAWVPASYRYIHAKSTISESAAAIRCVMAEAIEKAPRTVTQLGELTGLSPVTIRKWLARQIEDGKMKEIIPPKPLGKYQPPYLYAIAGGAHDTQAHRINRQTTL